MRPDNQTKQAIANTTGNPKDIAEQYSVSVSSVYNYRRQFADSDVTPSSVAMNSSTGVFDQRAKSGLIRSGGQVEEEFLRELQDDGGAKLYTEMSHHPVVAAVLFAIQMAQRKVRLFVEPASEDEVDKEAAEFLEECLEDMSQTLDDIVSQVFTMLKYGFSAAELVYKKRQGGKPGKKNDAASSRFDDGKIGWRRWQFISPRTLAVGSRWQWDEQGRVLSLTQQPPPTYGDITVPIEKLLLFRTRVEWDNPEGYSVLRPMYEPWYYAKNLAEIEAITAERSGAGFPVMYLGYDTKKGEGGDLAAAETYVKNVRNDEQMGLALPYPKLGTAGEGRGILFEFVSPPSKGPVDFNAVIDRYEKRMAMVVLAQFIFLGMASAGTQALAGTVVDVFQEAIAAWSTMMADVINRFAIPRLFALNPFNVEALPQLKHSAASVPNLAEIAQYVNSLVGAQVITPDESLEKHLREMADLPEKPEEAIEIISEEEVEPELDEDEADESVEVEEEPEDASERFGLKTIKGALARNEAGKFERGSGAAIDDKDIASADALLNGRMTPAQASQFQAAGLMGERGGKKFLTPQGRNIQRMMASNPRAAVAKMRTALKGAKPQRAKTPSVKPGEKKPGKAGGGAGGGGKGGKGGKGKKPKKGGGKGGGGGAAKPEEKAKIGDEQQARVDLLIEGGMSEELAVALSLIYDSGSPNAIAREQDPKIAAQLQKLGFLDTNDKGESVVSESGKRLTTALKNKDDDVVGEELEGKFSEDFVTRTRRGGPKWERETNNYESRLRSEYNSWADQTARELVNADEDEFDDKLQDAVIALTFLLTRLGRQRLPGAFQLGLAETPATPDGIMKLAEQVRSNDQFLQDSLAPDIEAKVRNAIEQDTLIAQDEDSLRSVLGTFAARVGSYAGRFWSLIMWGFGDRLRQDPDNPRVRWVRDARAKHCQSCLDFGSDTGKVYDSFDDLLAATGGVLPSDGTICMGNCRCWLEKEVKPGVWVRM